MLLHLNFIYLIDFIGPGLHTLINTLAIHLSVNVPELAWELNFISSPKASTEKQKEDFWQEAVLNIEWTHI